jgi:hypothetical protein
MLDIHSRCIYDFLDSLVSMGFLERKRIKETTEYSNSLLSSTYLDSNTPNKYLGGILIMYNNEAF